MRSFLPIASALAVLTAGLTAQTHRVLAQYPNSYAIVESSKWSSPTPFDVESADDFDFTGTVERVIAFGYYSFQSPPPADITGVFVRFYASANDMPGALQHEVFVAQGDPRFVHTPTPTELDVTLPQPFAASGKHFVSVQLVSQSAQSWQWWSASNGPPATTRLASAYRRDRGAQGPWQVHETVLGQELDLAFELWGSDATVLPLPIDPCGPWEEVAVPPLPSNYGTTVLRDLVVIADDDVWAVGDPSVEVQFLNYEYKNLALHWDGEEWREVPTPNPSVFPAPFGSTGLQAVDALSSSFVWALGNYETRDDLGFVIDQPLVLRWNGSSWDQLEVANPNLDSYAYGVKLLAPNDAWIVGGQAGFCSGGMAVHWDGSSFRVTPTPGSCVLPGGTPGFDLEDVDGVASDDVWAVGGGSDGDFSAQTYVLHWDGSAWSHVSAPGPGFARRLFDVHARASDDVWAVGQYEEIVGPSVQYFAWAIHWDGSSWTLHDGATQPIGSGAVHAVGPNDVYTAGGRITHWDGTAWTVADDLGATSGAVLSPSVAGMDAVEPCHLWVAGRKIVGGQIVPFTARHADGLTWRVNLRGCAAYPGVTNGIALLSPPRLGGSFAVAIGDPLAQTGFAPQTTQTLWLLGAVPAAGSSCSVVLPGFGVGFAPGAVLVDVLSAPVLSTAPVAWNGPTAPGVHSFSLPNVASLAGFRIATQGLLVDPSAPSPVAVTGAMDATIGF